MTNTRAFLSGAFILLACAATAAAQGAGQTPGATTRRVPPPAREADAGAETARLLRSDTLGERAWGAHLVWRHGLREQLPALVALLEDPALRSGGEAEYVLRAALDSLIQLDARPTAETLRPLYARFPDEVLILLGRAPAENEAVLAALFEAEPPGARWVAAANLLAEVRSRSLALPLLRGLSIEADVFLVNEGQDFNTGGGVGGGGCGADYSAPPRGFPPVGFYGLTEEAARGAVVAAPGRHVVYYVRGDGPNACLGAGVHFNPRWSDEYRRDYLADLLNVTPDGLEFRVTRNRTVVCDERTACRRSLLALRREIETSYATLLAALVAGGHVEASDAEPLRPDITFRLHDYRTRAAFPAPRAVKGVKVIVE